MLSISFIFKSATNLRIKYFKIKFFYIIFLHYLCIVSNRGYVKLKDMLTTRRGSYGNFLEIRPTELEATVWKYENSTENEDKLMSIVQEICDLKGVDFKEYIENYIKD